jgi:hypothetical protein
LKEIRDAMGEHTSLTRPCAREDQHGTIGMLDGRALDVVEELGLRQH